MNPDNVAARLYNVLSETSKHGSRLDPWKVHQVWAQTFGVPHDDLYQIFHHLIVLRQLLDEVEKQIKAIPNINHEVYLKRFSKIRKALAPTNFQEDWFKSSHIDEGMLATLEFCAERLSATSPEKTPLDDEIEALWQAVESLKEQILSEEVDAQLQSILLDLVESMRRAIHEYRFWGVDGLRQELFSILERLQKYYPIIQQHSDDPVVLSFWNVLTKFDTLTSIYLNVPQILGGLKKLLGSGD